MKHKKVVTPFLFLLFLILSFSCSSPSEPTIPLAPGGYYPIVTGIYITSVNGSIKGKMGTPNGNSGGDGSGRYDGSPIFGLPSPNPSKGPININYTIPYSGARVMIWAVRARTESNSERLLMFNNSALLRAGGKPYKVIYDGVNEAGNHAIYVEFKNKDDEIDTGIYRIYLKIEHKNTKDKLLWQDVIIIN